MNAQRRGDLQNAHHHSDIELQDLESIGSSNLDHHSDIESQADLESLGSSNIAQPSSDSEQESTAECSILVHHFPTTKVPVVTYTKI